MFNNNNIHREVFFNNNESSAAAWIFCDIAALNVDIQDQTSWNNRLFSPLLCMTNTVSKYMLGIDYTVQYVQADP